MLSDPAPKPDVITSLTADIETNPGRIGPSVEPVARTTIESVPEKPAALTEALTIVVSKPVMDPHVPGQHVGNSKGVAPIIIDKKMNVNATLAG